MSAPATTLYIARHGETLWNTERRMQGHLDSPLSALGVEQALALAARMHELQPAALYSSDLGRALRTAEIIAGSCGLEPRVDEQLRERHLGIFQSLTWAEIERRYPEAWQRFAGGNPDFVIPGGESARQRYERSLVALERLAGKHPGERIAVVGHGGTLDSIFRACGGIPLEKKRSFGLANASLNVVQYRGRRWHLITWGDVAHLAGDAAGHDG